MKFLICGVGSIGSRHLENIIELGYSDIILLRTGKSNIPSLDKYSKYQTFYNIEDALAQNPDICVISNPTSLHVKTAIIAANSGCHLFIEKPLSHSLEGLSELESIIKRKKLISLVTYQFRYNPHIKLLKNLIINTTKYGVPIYASAEWSEYLPDWHPWEDYKQSYASNSELGGGVLLTQIHPLNYLNFLFGDIKKVLVHKQASKNLGINVDDTADILIDFSNGMSGHVHVDFIQKPRVHNLKIVTSLGRFEWNCHENTLIFLDMSGDIEEFKNPKFERNDMFVKMMSSFINDVNLCKSTGFTVSDAITEIKFLVGNHN